MSRPFGTNKGIRLTYPLGKLMAMTRALEAWVLADDAKTVTTEQHTDAVDASRVLVREMVAGLRMAGVQIASEINPYRDPE